MQKKNICDLCEKASFKKLYSLANFNILQCFSCGLVFRNIALTKNEAELLYNKGYFTDEQKDYFFNNIPRRKEIFTFRLKQLEQIYPQKGALLDVGCAIGTFMLVARDSGWHVKGVEISEFASRYAVENFLLDVLTGELVNQNLAPLSFDVITLWDMIDHAEFPQAVLECAYRLLKPNGLIVVETTMENSLLYRIAHYIYMVSGGLIKQPVTRCHPLHHSTFYSTKTMRIALQTAGFTVISENPSNLPPDFINTNKLARFILNCIAFCAKIINRPLETTFYAKKSCKGNEKNS